MTVPYGGTARATVIMLDRTRCFISPLLHAPAGHRGRGEGEGGAVADIVDARGLCARLRRARQADRAFWAPLVAWTNGVSRSTRRAG